MTYNTGSLLSSQTITNKVYYCNFSTLRRTFSENNQFLQTFSKKYDKVGGERGGRCSKFELVPYEDNENLLSDCGTFCIKSLNICDSKVYP